MFKRMPFRLKMAPRVFVIETKMNQKFERCERIVGIADDIVIFGTTMEEHDQSMYGVLKRCSSRGLKLHPDRYFVEQEKVRFCGVFCGQHMIQLES